MLQATTINLVITIVFTGLTAGLCFTWGNAVTPGIGQLSDKGFLEAFQQMNRSIINPTFALVFFGPFFGHLINVYAHRSTIDKSFWLFVAAAALYIGGLVLVTLLKNVPLNEILDKTDLVLASAEELKDLRKLFEKPWNRWHNIRTITSTASFTLAIFGLLSKYIA